MAPTTKPLQERSIAVAECRRQNLWILIRHAVKALSLSLCLAVPISICDVHSTAYVDCLSVFPPSSQTRASSCWVPSPDSFCLEQTAKETEPFVYTWPYGFVGHGEGALHLDVVLLTVHLQMRSLGIHAPETSKAFVSTELCRSQARKREPELRGTEVSVSDGSWIQSLCISKLLHSVYK